ncbi:hypothetical protein CDAR_497801 [Caerostris darwini]|uniref:Uncharacterized protein n=1 Tax=Caerostris darwini TaxID=1538125 RepID=A0AAV4PNI8_9ARAC|nr:hypothetical protein CDAR_497801 [Caerostris darwini]
MVTLPLLETRELCLSMYSHKRRRSTDGPKVSREKRITEKEHCQIACYPGDASWGTEGPDRSGSIAHRVAFNGGALFGDHVIPVRRMRLSRTSPDAEKSGKGVFAAWDLYL